MSRTDILMQHGYSDRVVSTYYHHIEARGIYDANRVDAVYPVDPRTGLPATDLGRLTDISLTNGEKETIMARLQRMDGTYLPSGMSDADIYSLVPPRYFENDEVDIQAWRNYLSKEILPNMSDDVQGMLSDEVTDVSTADTEDA